MNLKKKLLVGCGVALLFGAGATNAEVTLNQVSAFMVMPAVVGGGGIETYVTITHPPTGITASAGERRSQIQNRGQATRRLRLALAREVRTKVDRNNHRRSELWEQRKQGKQRSVNPDHTDYPSLLAEALDVIYARKFDVAGSAGVLGVSMSQLAKLVRHDKRAFGLINQGREERGMPRLK